MPSAPGSMSARTALRGAIVTTSMRLAPGHGMPDSRHLALLAEAEPLALPRLWNDESAATLSTLLAARARRDALSGGVELIERYFDGAHLTRPATLSDGVRSQLFASAAEYCCALGWPQMGVRFGREAHLFADTDEQRYRALAFTTLGHAFDGEYATAEETMTEAHAIFAAHGWPRGEVSYGLLLADAIVAFAHLNGERLAHVVDEMNTARPSDPYWDYATRAIQVMHQLVSHDYSGAMASSWQLLNGGRRHHSLRMVRDILVGTRADVFIAQGDYVGGLAAPSPPPAVEGHGICPAVPRAGCLLMLGRERELLIETDECVAVEAGHSPRTLTPLLLRRAIAFGRLGSVRRAQQSMESALLLLSRTGNPTGPFVMLPREEASRLVDLVVRARPELATLVPQIRRTLATMAAPSPAGDASRRPAFTPTELALSNLLLTELSLSEIAYERGVSLNTVKSQVRSIYAKLGVGSRADAITRLRPIMLL